jgi:hypothetical protein
MENKVLDDRVKMFMRAFTALRDFETDIDKVVSMDIEMRRMLVEKNYASHCLERSEIAMVAPCVSKILHKWKCSEKDMSILLGFECEVDYRLMLSNPEAHEFSEEQVVRMSYILNIYRSLHTLFNRSVERANDWVNSPNNAPLFKGKPAIGLMKSGKLPDLAGVAEYLLSIL